MIITAKQVYESRLRTRDNRTALLRDVLFDDRSWSVRYLVARLRHLFGHEDVLLSPEQLGDTAWPTGELHTSLSMVEVEAAPRLLSDPPVAKQGELKVSRMVAWEAYWTGLFDRFTDFGDPHLRNTRAVTGHRVYGLDSEAGFIDNFVLDDQDWRVRYLIVRLGKHLSSRRVMVDPNLVDSINWEGHGVWIHLPKKSIEQCQEFVASS